MDFLQTVLFLGADPKDMGQQRLDQELRDITEGLQRSAKRDRFNLQQSWAIRSGDIQRAMLDVKPHILHFAGHGEGGLFFLDDAGNSNLVNGAALAGLFKLFDDKLNCVVLNGCYAEVQAKAISQHIPYVVGVQKAIGSPGALAFAVDFYDALGAGRDVEPSGLLRIQAPAQMGKTSYLERLVAYAQDLNYRVVRIDLRQVANRCCEIWISCCNGYLGRSVSNCICKLMLPVTGVPILVARTIAPISWKNTS
jgi:hypothetical protein